ncbi:hypothetical protein SDC9_118735 [bioreactor metagenome]|uniref:Uncharacterized protein n=1 Tax=bioreactor metagenome TaxID=1076179 RepID=A0A645C936_9ZZZZ
MHPTGGFYAQFWANGLAHEGYIFHGGAAARKTSGGLHKICASLFGQLAGDHFFIIRQQRRLNDHFEERVTLMGGLRHCADIIGHRQIVATLYGANINDHIHFLSALLNCHLGLIGFRSRTGGAKREANDRAHLYITALEQFGVQRNMAGVHAHRSKMVVFGFVAQLHDLICGSIRLEQGVVNFAG